MAISKVLYSSETDQHCTPKWLALRIVKFLDGVELDPCTTYRNPIAAADYYTVDHDGLAQSWQARTVYMNPPYGRGVEAWTSKLADEYERGRIDEAVALLPARTDTKWWKSLAKYPVCFITGRLQFNDCGQSAPFPSALFYLGDNWQGFDKAFGNVGLVYIPIAYLQRVKESYLP